MDDDEYIALVEKGREEFLFQKAKQASLSQSLSPSPAPMSQYVQTATAAANRPTRGGPLVRMINPFRMQDGLVIRWMQHKRYLYAAIFTNDMFYITGKGEWFGTNALTYDQMNDVLSRPVVDWIQVPSSYGDGVQYLNT